MKHDTNVIAVNVVEVLVVVSRLGAGTDDDPVRHITEYYEMDGSLLFRFDSLKDDEKAQP